MSIEAIAWARSQSIFTSAEEKYIILLMAIDSGTVPPSAPEYILNVSIETGIDLDLVGNTVKSALEPMLNAMNAIRPHPSKKSRQVGKEVKKQDRDFILGKASGLCAYCKKTSSSLQIDHVIPRSRGGSRDRDNLVAACPDCNAKKGSRLLSEWVR